MKNMLTLLFLPLILSACSSREFKEVSQIFYTDSSDWKSYHKVNAGIVQKVEPYRVSTGEYIVKVEVWLSSEDRFYSLESMEWRFVQAKDTAHIRKALLIDAIGIRDRCQQKLDKDTIYN